MKCLIIFFVCTFTFSCENKEKSKVQLKAISIAKNEWKKEFKYDDEKLSNMEIDIRINGKNWIVKGSLANNREGGVPIAIIDTSTFKIIEVYHTK